MNVLEWFAAGRWYSPVTPVPFTNKIDCHDVAEIFLKGYSSYDPTTRLSDSLIVRQPDSSVVRQRCVCFFTFTVRSSKNNNRGKHCGNKQKKYQALGSPIFLNISLQLYLYEEMCFHLNEGIINFSISILISTWRPYDFVQAIYSGLKRLSCLDYLTRTIGKAYIFQV
jgi:hypothetical protein